ncbi:MAG: hypothetical protein ABMA64_34355 [Myxococcota bacterium]
MIAAAPDRSGPTDPTDLGPTELRATVSAMEALAARVSPSPDVVAAVIDLETNCAYNRATFVVVSTLDRELGELDVSALSADQRATFDALVRGVSAQASVARTLGALELPAPIPGDYLFGDYVHGAGVYQDGASFAASADPVGDAQALLVSVPGRVAAMPASTVQRVEADWRTVGRAVDDGQWFDAIHTWAATYHALAPALGRGETGDRAARIERLLAQHGGIGC